MRGKLAHMLLVDKKTAVKSSWRVGKSNNEDEEALKGNHEDGRQLECDREQARQRRQQ